MKMPTIPPEANVTLEPRSHGAIGATVRDEFGCSEVYFWLKCPAGRAALAAYMAEVIYDLYQQQLCISFGSLTWEMQQRLFLLDWRDQWLEWGGWRK